LAVAFSDFNHITAIINCPAPLYAYHFQARLFRSAKVFHIALAFTNNLNTSILQAGYILLAGYIQRSFEMFQYQK